MHPVMKKCRNERRMSAVILMIQNLGVIANKQFIRLHILNLFVLLAILALVDLYLMKRAGKY